MQLEIVKGSATRADLYPCKMIMVKKAILKVVCFSLFSNNYIIQIIACLLKHISLICVTEKWLNIWGNKKYPFVLYVSNLSNNFLILDLNCRQWFISKQNFHYLTCLLLQFVQGLKKTKWKDSSGNMHISKK